MPKKPIESLIFTIRDRKVILDADLAELYGVPTKRLNEQVKRNADRFPEDFTFQLTQQEWRNLKSQIVTSSLEASPKEDVVPNWSQFATSSKRRYTARTPEELYPDRPDLREFHETLPDGWLVSTNLNNVLKKTIVKLAAEVAGLTFGKDVIVEF